MNAWERANKMGERYAREVLRSPETHVDPCQPPEGTCEVCLSADVAFMLCYGPSTCERCGVKYEETQPFHSRQCLLCAKITATCPMCLGPTGNVPPVVLLYGAPF